MSNERIQYGKRATRRVKGVNGPGAPDRVRREENEAHVRSGVARGQSDNEIALAGNMSSRTVIRIRQRLGLPSGWTR